MSRAMGWTATTALLGEIFLDGKNVNLEIVKTGLAEVYRGDHAPGFDPAPHDQAEREAIAAERGMWPQGDKYVSSREWRRRQTGNKSSIAHDSK
jgi:micrococcal nuclease